jgi:hypothetical protein
MNLANLHNKASKVTLGPEQEQPAPAHGSPSPSPSKSAEDSEKTRSLKWSTDEYPSELMRYVFGGDDVRKKNVLILGCADRAALCEGLVRDGFQSVMGVDSDGDAIDILDARAQAAGISDSIMYHEMDLTFMTVAGRSISGAVDPGTIDELWRSGSLDDLQDICKEVMRTLVPGRRFLIRGAAPISMFCDIISKNCGVDRDQISVIELQGGTARAFCVTKKGGTEASQLSPPQSVCEHPKSAAVPKTKPSPPPAWSWVQSMEDLTVSIPLSDGLRLPAVVEICPEEVKVVGDGRVIFKGTLYHTILTSQSNWYCEDGDHGGRVLQLLLQKKYPRKWTEAFIDVCLDSLIAPPASDEHCVTKHAVALAPTSCAGDAAVAPLSSETLMGPPADSVPATQCGPPPPVAEVPKPPRVAIPVDFPEKEARFLLEKQVNIGVFQLLIWTEPEWIILTWDATFQEDSTLTMHCVVCTRDDEKFCLVQTVLVDEAVVAASATMDVLEDCAVLRVPYASLRVDEDLGVDCLRQDVPGDEELFDSQRAHPIDFLCRFCLAPISRPGKVKRALPLPSGRFDEVIDDMICFEGPTATPMTAREVSYGQVGRCLVGETSLLLHNADVVEGSVNLEDSKLTCGRCQSPVGMLLPSDPSTLVITSHRVIGHNGELAAYTARHWLMHEIIQAADADHQCRTFRIAVRDWVESPVLQVKLNSSSVHVSLAAGLAPTRALRVTYREFDEVSASATSCRFASADKMRAKELMVDSDVYEQVRTILRDAALPPSFNTPATARDGDLSFLF